MGSPSSSNKLLITTNIMQKLANLKAPGLMDGWKITSTTRIIHGCPLLSKPRNTYIIFQDLG